MLLSITFEELLNLLNTAKNNTINDEFYNCVAYDKIKRKFEVFNVLFLDTENSNLIPLYQFNPEEHSQNLEAVNCATIIYKELLTTGFKAFCNEYKITLEFVFNGTVFKYYPAFDFNLLKVGDKIKIYCTGALVDAEIIELTENSLTASHKPIKWGLDTLTRTTSFMVQSYTGKPQKMTPHCFVNDVHIYA